MSQSCSTRAIRGFKRQSGAQTTGEEKVSEAKDGEQVVKSLGRSYHEALEAHIPFLRAKHYLNFPAM